MTSKHPSSKSVVVPVTGAPDGGLNTKTSYFTRDQIAKLQENSQNRVYEYEYDQTDNTLTPDQLEQIFREVRDAYLEIRQAKTMAKDVEIREFLMESNPVWKQIATHSHTKMFEYVTSSKFRMEHLVFLIHLKADEIRSNMIEETRMQKFNDYFHKELDTGMTVEEYQKKIKEQDEQEGQPTKFGLSMAPKQ